MNISTFKKALVGLVLSAVVTLFGVSCGNTMYGMGLDMERTGRRLQTNHDPNASGAGGYQAPQQQPYTTNPYGY